MMNLLRIIKTSAPLTAQITMEHLLPQLLAFPPHPPPKIPLSDAEYDKQIKAVISTLGSVQASKLTSGVPGGGDFLSIIDPSINTIPYLYVLLAHIIGGGGKQKAGNVSETFQPGTALWEKALDFLDRFDSVQIRYAGNQLRQLVDLVAMKANFMSDPSAAIASIGSAILRIDPEGLTFTSTHLIFARMCLHSQLYSAALPVLDKDVWYFPQSTNKTGENSKFPYLCSDHHTSSTFITPESGLSAKLGHRHHLQYFLFGAMIYLGLKEWKQALAYLEAVLISPITSNASKIQVEAYKKWCLVNLIDHGRTAKMPKTTSAQAARQYHALGKSYEALGEVFESSLKGEETNERLLAEASQGTQLWATDFNFGLVRQVIDAYREFAIVRLGDIYAGLTAVKVAQKTSPEPNNYVETGRFVDQLITAKKLNAEIVKPSDNPGSWKIRFFDATSGPLALSEEQRHEELLDHQTILENLNERIRETDRKMSLSKEYIGDAKKKKKENPSGGADEMAHWMNQDSPFDHDEDMMADL